MAIARTHRSVVGRLADILTAAGVVALVVSLVLAVLPGAVSALGTITFTVDVTSGPAPLTVAGSGDWERPGCGADEYWVEIDWGDGTVDDVGPHADCNNDDVSGGSYSADHTYLSPGTYQACAILRHQLPQGADVAESTCEEPEVIVVTPEAGSLFIQKTWTGDDIPASPSVEFTLTGDGFSDTVTVFGDDTVEVSVPDVDLTYTVTEQESGLPANCSLVTGNPQFATGGETAAFTNGCVAIPSEPGSITVVKSGANGAEPGEWAFTISPDPNTAVVKASGETFSDLPLGTYLISESGPANWSFESVDCGDRQNPTSVVIGAGDQVTCTYVNTPDPGSITVQKDIQDSDGGDVSDSTTFTALLDGGTPQTFGEGSPATYPDLPPGSYDITEDLSGGYTLDSIVGDDNAATSSVAEVTIAAGQDRIVTFVNRQPPPLPPSCELVDVSLTNDGPVTAPITLVNFTANVSGSALGSLSYAWDVDNDGTPEDTAIDDNTFSWDYGGAGSFTAAVLVTDLGFEGDGDCAVTDTDPVTINTAETPTPTSTPVPPGPTPTPVPPGPTPTPTFVSEVLEVVVLPGTGFGPPSPATLSFGLRMLGSALMILTGMGLRRVGR